MKITGLIVFHQYYAFELLSQAMLCALLTRLSSKELFLKCVALLC